METNLVKSNLQLFLPALVEMVGDSKDFPWHKIDRLFSKKLQNRIIDFNNGKNLIEATIYDIIIEAKKGNATAIGHLDFLNKLFEELSDNLSLSEKGLVKTNVKHMLITLDKNHRNYIGEIAVLNNLIKSKTYRLNGIETKLPNGKSIDFKLEIIGKEKFLLVEVMNIHLEENRIDDSACAIEKFLTDRFLQKIESKTMALTESIEFFLVPVIWGDWRNLKVYSDFFKAKSIKLNNVIEPVSYLTYSDDKGYYEHHFKTISKLFK